MLIISAPISVKAWNDQETHYLILKCCICDSCFYFFAKKFIINYGYE